MRNNKSRRLAVPAGKAAILMNEEDMDDTLQLLKLIATAGKRLLITGPMREVAKTAWFDISCADVNIMPVEIVDS